MALLEVRDLDAGYGDLQILNTVKFDHIDAINDSDTAVLMVEQNTKEALRRCDRGYVLVQGQYQYEDEEDVLL